MLSIILGAVAIFIFGAVWFTFLFGKTWARLMDFNPAGDEKAKEMGMGQPMVLNFLSNLLIAGVLYYIIPQILVSSFTNLLKVFGVVWLAFSFPIFANAAIWERKSWKLVAINSVQNLIALAIVSAIVFYMYAPMGGV